MEYEKLKNLYYKNLYMLRGMSHFEQYLKEEKAYQRKTIPGEILGFIENKEKKVMLVNRGKRDGILPHMVVVSGITIFGRITSVFDSYAEVLLLDDEKQSISVLFQESALKGIAKGKRKEKNKTMLLMHLYDDTTKEPVIGELVYASGKGLIFPAGYVVGKVSEIKTINYLERAIYIENEYDLNTVDRCEILSVSSCPQELINEIKTVEI